MKRRRRKDPVKWMWALLGYVALLLICLAAGKVLQ